MRRRHTKIVLVLLVVFLLIGTSVVSAFSVNLKDRITDFIESKVENFLDKIDNESYSSIRWSYDGVMDHYLDYEESSFYKHYIKRPYEIFSDDSNSDYLKEYNMYLEHHHELMEQYEDNPKQRVDFSPSEKPDFENGTTWYVDDVSGEGPDNPSEDFTRIQDAIDSDLIKDGDTIYVFSGLYQENIEISKSIILQGEDRNHTIIDGSEKYYIVEMNANWVNIIGFCLQNGETGIGVTFSSNIIIKNNIFQSNGITIFGYNKEYWNTHIIENNVANGRPIRYYKNTINVTIPLDTSQLILANCSNFSIKNLNLNAVDMAIQIGHSNNNIILENTINNNKNGILLYKSTNNNISNNIVNNNEGFGINLDESSNNKLSNNIICNNSYYGIYLDDSNNLILANNVSNNGDGIKLYRSFENKITDNIISNSNRNGEGLWLTSSSHNNISGNYVTWNHKDGIRIDGNSDYNLIINNRVNNNTRSGLCFYGDKYFKKEIPDNNNISGNTIISNNFAIHLWESCNNLLTMNFMTKNSNGIWLEGSTNNSILKNRVINNKNEGIWLDGSSNNKIIENSVNENFDGIYSSNFLLILGLIPIICNSKYNFIKGNICFRNDVDGIGLTYMSMGNIVENNICIENMKGIAIRDSNNNKLLNNLCEENINGIILNNGRFTLIKDNDLIRNGIGIYSHSSSGNSISNNNIIQNSHKGIAITQFSNLNTIKNNNVGPLNYQGIYMELSGFNNINQNNLTKNNDGGILLYGTLLNLIHNNNFFDNTNYNINDDFNIYDIIRSNIFKKHLNINRSVSTIRKPLDPQPLYIKNCWKSWINIIDGRMKEVDTF